MAVLQAGQGTLQQQWVESGRDKFGSKADPLGAPWKTERRLGVEQAPSLFELAKLAVIAVNYGRDVLP